MMRLFIGIMILLFMAGCANEAKQVYEEATYGRPLEVPPDLTAPSVNESTKIPELIEKTATVPTESSDCNGSDKTPLSVLPDQENIQLVRDGSQRWLILQGEPSQLWPWIREFFIKNGFKFSIEDPLIGVIETEWKQQQLNLPMTEGEPAGQGQGNSKVYAVPTREKYRVRLERGDKPGTTEVYLTHRGVELISQDDMVVWRLRSADPELESETLKRLMVFLGEEQQKAGGLLANNDQRLRHATLIQDTEGHEIVKVDSEFSSVWHRTGLALDRLNFLIEKSNRLDGIYLVRTKDPLKEKDIQASESWFSHLFSKTSAEVVKHYQVMLLDEGSATHIKIRNIDGVDLDNPTAEPILKQLLGQLQ